MELFNSEYQYDQVWWQLSCNRDIPNWAILSNNDEATKESINYGVPHQVVEPTSRIFSVGRWILHMKASTTNLAFGTTLVWRGGAC